MIPAIPRERSTRTKPGLQAAAWMAAVLLALAAPGSYLTQGGPPNLKPYQPEGWSDAIVVSTRQGDHLNARRLTSTDPSMSISPSSTAGGSPVRAPFRIDLYLDGALWDSFDVPAPLTPGPTASGDYLIRRLAPAPIPCGSWPTGAGRFQRAMNPTTTTPGP